MLITKGYGSMNLMRERTSEAVVSTEKSSCAAVGTGTEKASCTATTVPIETRSREDPIHAWIDGSGRDRLLRALPPEIMLFPEAQIEATRRDSQLGAAEPPEVLPLAGAFIEASRSGVPESREAQIEATRRGFILPSVLGVTLFDATCNDTYMADFAATTNFSTATVIQLRSASFSGVNRTGLLKFLAHGIPSTATILSADLLLTLHDLWSGSPQAYFVQRLLRDFVNSEATWNEWASGQAWTAGGAAGPGFDYSDVNEALFTLQTGDPPGTQYVVDVKDIVQDEVTAAETNLNFRIFQEEFGAFTALASTDHATSEWHPKLTITYQV
jgi:hypothetical protein